ncbi:hypothetical protein [Pinibacter soli]|uniref:Uncharacterized protein n=1 Tax=Pinibacter soli TaxID=3044211 RepID=A0ABT6RFQ2_9BACT|nr:hypothetical protein [Pinibacter soli]MDI3321401.1 hypothetical protein [Pinibacter soli]
MKNIIPLLSLLTILLSSCDEPVKTKLPTILHADSGTDMLSTTVIEEELEDCTKSIAKYEELIDKTLGGDAEAMKKLSRTKEKIEGQLEELEEWSANFAGKQAQQFAALQKKFQSVSSRIH